MNTNYYTILEIEKSASSKEIKTSFRRLAHQYHPDKGGDEKKFKEINEAYQTLSDAEKRASYDRFGSQSFTGFNSGQSTNGFTRNYADFSGTATGAQFTSHLLKKIPGWAWFFLLPLIIVVSFVGLVVVFVWIVFSTIRTMFIRNFE